MRDAVIVDAVRTPTGKRNGALKDWHPVDLSAHVLTALVERTGIDPALVDDVIWGVVSTWAERSTGCQSFSAPLRFPVGVRTASTITASRMVVPSAQVPSRVPGGAQRRPQASCAVRTPTATMISTAAAIIPASCTAVRDRPVGA